MYSIKSYKGCIKKAAKERYCLIYFSNYEQSRSIKKEITLSNNFLLKNIKNEIIKEFII